MSSDPEATKDLAAELIALAERAGVAILSLIHI